MKHPKSLLPGDKIGIISPSSPVQADDLQRGIERIIQRGYQVVLADHVLSTVDSNDYLAGTDIDRAKDLHDMLVDDKVAAIFCATGGYGSMRLFPFLDTDILRRHPKLFAGYSDITSLHLVWNQHAEMVTFYGPNVTQLSRLNERASNSFWNLLENPREVQAIPSEPDETATLVEGTAEGELAGGCLCLLAHACGSRYTPDLKNKIVLIEDVGEAIYRVDRYVVQLLNAGALDQAAGFIVGTITDWQKKEPDLPVNTPQSLWADLLAPLNKPTITGFPFGHEPNPLTLPLGMRVRLDACARTVQILHG